MQYPNREVIFALMQEFQSACARRIKVERLLERTSCATEDVLVYLQGEVNTHDEAACFYLDKLKEELNK
jgi:DNA polymerase III delta prime subunit